MRSPSTERLVLSLAGWGCLFSAALTGCQDAAAPAENESAAAAASSSSPSPNSSGRLDLRTPTTKTTGETESPPSPIRFTDVTENSGIDFVHQTGTSPEKPFPAANGSGIATLDYDLDGRYDLYFACGTPFPVNPTRSRPVDRFYRNRGDFRFQEVTEPSGLGHNGYSAGLAVGDFDADGFPDLYVTCYGANRLYHNMGDGTFREVGALSEVDNDRWATSAAWFDENGDGLLDLYVCNYAQWTLETNQFCGDRTRNVRLYCNPKQYPPQRDVFYRNGGDGTFADLTSSAGLAERAGRGQGVIAADLNNDGRTDLYVANDLHPNFLYLNRDDLPFQDSTDLSGAAYDARGNPQAGMGVDAADVNQDGRFDLFVTNYQDEHNAFYENLGNEIFHDKSDVFGLGAASLPWVGWGTMFGDFDLDGWLDVIVTNGHTDDNFHEMGSDWPYQQPPLLWRNQQGRFTPLGAEVGAYFAERHVGRALAVADLDNDGDTDLVIGHQDAPPTILRNDARSPGRFQAPEAMEKPPMASTPIPGKQDQGPHSVRLHLVGTRSNRDAVGSRITLRSSQRRVVHQIKGGGSYLSAHDLRLVLAVRPDETDLTVEIQWPDRRTSSQVDVRPGKRYTVIQPRDGALAPRVLAGPLLPSVPQ